LKFVKFILVYNGLLLSVESFPDVVYGRITTRVNAVIINQYHLNKTAKRAEYAECMHNLDHMTANNAVTWHSVTVSTRGLIIIRTAA